MSRREFLAQEWSPLNVKSFSSYTNGSGFKVFWEHKCECGEKHIWEAVINSRSKGANCPICASKGKYVCPCRSLQTLRPDLARQWHPTKNDKTPAEISLCPGKKFWWFCPKSNCEHLHEWQATISNRSKGKKLSCPFCSNQKRCSCRSLANMRPEIAAQWHPTKNKLSPNEVSYGSTYRAWWLCQKGKCEHPHEWQTTVNNRINGTGCPWCVNRKICGCNSLAGFFPELISEWSSKNKVLPWQVAPSCNEKYLWECFKGHEWSTSCAARTILDHGCPLCKVSHGEKLVRRILESLKIEYISQYRITTEKYRRLYLDFYLPKYNCAIEFDGIQHFEPRKIFGGEDGFQKVKDRDLWKNIYFTENGISLLRIHYSDTAEIEDGINFLINPPTVLTFRLYTANYPKF